jgi:hypothetical protein
MNARFDIRAEARVFSSPCGDHLYLADGSRIFDLERATAQAIATDIDAGRAPDALSGLIGEAERFIGPDPAEPPPVKSLSLNVAQFSRCTVAHGGTRNGVRLRRRDPGRPVALGGDLQPNGDTRGAVDLG